jgi:hypothetical protein
MGALLSVIDLFASLKALPGAFPVGDLHSRTYRYSTTARTTLQGKCCAQRPHWRRRGNEARLDSSVSSAPLHHCSRYGQPTFHRRPPSRCAISKYSDAVHTSVSLSRRRLPLPPCNTAAIPPVYLLASYCTAATYFDVDGILTEGVSLIIDTRHRLVGLLAFASALLPRHGNSKEELSSTEPPEPGVAPVLSLRGASNENNR